MRKNHNLFISRQAKALLFGALTLPATGAVNAQEAAIEEIVVTGTRQVIQDQIAIKRSAVQIVDGLSAEDIGDLPALSIGEALESITGAASHREDGGATEISIRGLGPFLSSTTLNGREVSNGGGDRSVNFSQFPSELMNKLAIYKTQNASQIEGGVAGQVQLETLKPLDYNKTRTQIDLKANLNPDDLNVDNSLRSHVGFRGTASFVDQINFDNGAELGVSFGMQQMTANSPEQQVRSSTPQNTSLFACVNDPSSTDRGIFNDEDCEDIDRSPVGGYNTTIDPGTGQAIDQGTPFVWAPSSRSYRQNETSEERDSYFAAFQLQPNDRLDINLDLQTSSRIQSESRHDLLFQGKRLEPTSVVATESGAVLEYTAINRIEANGEWYQRQEDYHGRGLNFAYDVSDQLVVSADISYSRTNREELQISNRTRTSGDEVAYYSLDAEGVPVWTVEDFDVNDHGNFIRDIRARADREASREMSIKGMRVDFEYETESDFVTNVYGGIRKSEIDYLQTGGNNTASGANGSRNTYYHQEGDAGTQIVPGTSENIIQLCANTSFPETGFLSDIAAGNLITNIDSSTGNPLEAGTGSSWATFDNLCFANAVATLTGNTFEYPDVEYQSLNTQDVTETTNAAYIMADYETNFIDRPLSGNFGVRVVKTSVDSIGFRTSFDVIETPQVDPATGDPLLDADTGEQVIALSFARNEGELTTANAGSNYTEILPSASFVWDYRDDLIIRGGLFKGLSRPDPADLSNARTISGNDDESEEVITNLNDLLQVQSSGNPELLPLTSWNADVSFEWYPNDDSILSLGLYYKKFIGGFEDRLVTETIEIDGVDTPVTFRNTFTKDDTSELQGIELTAAHRWDSGIGVKLSYNYADSDFVFEDGRYGDSYITDLDGTRVQIAEGIVPHANIPGFSEHTFSGQLYYQYGDFDIAAIYKYRSDYFQPYTGDDSVVRLIGDVGVWEAKASYRLTDSIQLKLEAINIFNEPKTSTYFVNDNLGEINAYGPRLFAGIKMKF